MLEWVLLGFLSTPSGLSDAICNIFTYGFIRFFEGVHVKRHYKVCLAWFAYIGICCWTFTKMIGFQGCESGLVLSSVGITFLALNG